MPVQSAKPFVELPPRCTSQRSIHKRRERQKFSSRLEYRHLRYNPNRRWLVRSETLRFQTGAIMARLAVAPCHLSAVSVVADRFDRTAFHRFFAKTFFVGRLRLLVNVRVAAVIVPLEVGGGGRGTNRSRCTDHRRRICLMSSLGIYSLRRPCFPEGEGGTLERKAPNAIICPVIDSDATATRR